MIARTTVKILQCVKPEDRVTWAARVFWWSILLGIYCTAFIAKDAFERILMAISWLAVTLTALDIVLTTDVRANDDEK